MTNEEFYKETEKLGIKLTNKQKEQLEEFYNILIEENQKINLTRIIDKEDVYLKHFYDSLTITKAINLEKIETLCDVGTGAGFPGIVLKIVFPNLDITLLDSLQKRVNYLNETIKKLNLKNVKAIHTRGEDYKDKFDVVTSRAVANIEKLVRYTMHLVNDNGIFVAMKGDITKELTKNVEQKLNKKYKIERIEEFNLPIENSKRSILIMKNKFGNNK